MKLTEFISINDLERIWRKFVMDYYVTSILSNCFIQS